MKETKLDRKLNDDLSRCLECGEWFRQEYDLLLCDKCMKKFDADKLWEMHDLGALDALDFNESQKIRERFRIK